MRGITSVMVIACAIAWSSIIAVSSAAQLDDMVVSRTNIDAGFIVKVREGSGYCEDLRLACEHKDRLGEQGAGNCRKYREECGSRQNHCERLRWQCMHKEELGATGMGICRRYREECK